MVRLRAVASRFSEHLLVDFAIAAVLTEVGLSA
jgi:hypothetical protein